MRDLSCWVKEFSHRLSLLLPSCPEARGPRDRCLISVLRSAHRAHRACLTCSWDPQPHPLARPEPRPWMGGCRSGRGPPPRREEPIRRCNLRRRVTRSAVGAAGWRYRLPAWTPGSRVRSAAPAGSEAVRSAAPRVPPPGPPCRAPLGTRAADCRAGRPPPSRPGRAAARAARSCTVLASSCRGCSASWPSAL